jgi:hypothetical protein
MTATTTPATKSPYKLHTLVGAGLGLVTFLAVGLLPTVLYGGYAGVLLAGLVSGTPVVATFAVKALIVVGMVVGVTAVAALFAAVGAAAGAAVGVLASGAWRARASSSDENEA